MFYIVGVYYGKRFGYPIEWVTTFPFNMNLYDPQYIGAVLSVWGWFFFFQLDEVPAVYLTICYIYMSLVEYREYTPAAETEASDSKDDVRSTKKVSRKRAQTVELSVDPKANDAKTTKAKTTKTTKTKTTTGKTTPTRRKLMKNTAAY